MKTWHVVMCVCMYVQQINSEAKCPVTAAEVMKRREYHGSLVGLLVLLFIILLMLIVPCVVCTVFAVRNPNSSVGQCLIQVSYLLTELCSIDISCAHSVTEMS